MFEYDDETKNRSLLIFGFDIDSLDLDKIVHVPMHQYRVATKEYPMLYVENLQCCIGLYAYSDDFGFAAHINPKVMRGAEYELNEEGKAIRLRRIDQLKNVILQHSFNQTVKVGISLGCISLGQNYPTMKMIYDAINNLINQLNLIGIEVEKLEDQVAPEFILDTTNGKIILPCDNQKDKFVKRLKCGGNYGRKVK